MRRRLIPGVLVLAGVACSSWATLPTPPSSRPGALLRPTCGELETDTCVTESVTLNPSVLGLGDPADPPLDRRPVPVRCVLRESGFLEGCRVLDPRGDDVDGALSSVLQTRRYEPVTYRGRKVLVPYTLLVSFTPPAAETRRTAAVRLDVFRALLLRLPSRVADAGSDGARSLVCVGVGDDIADPPRSELEALRRSGAQVEPASSCWAVMQAVGGAAPFGSVVVRDVQFDGPEVAQVRAEVGLSGQTPESLSLRASRLGDRWLIEELPVPGLADAGPVRRPKQP